MKSLFKHLKTVHIHRKYVRKMCWKMGLFWQGLMHDLSKYSIAEIKIAKYWSGDRSPHANARAALGYSPSWQSHYHKNKHHWQYWLDLEDFPDKFIPVKMPYKYVIEMFCDQVGASKAYMGKNYTIEAPWDYYLTKCKGKRLQSSETEYLLEKLIWNLKERGEKDFYKWYKHIKHWLKEHYDRGDLEFYEQSMGQA